MSIQLAIAIRNNNLDLIKYWQNHLKVSKGINNQGFYEFINKFVMKLDYKDFEEIINKIS